MCQDELFKCQDKLFKEVDHILFMYVGNDGHAWRFVYLLRECVTDRPLKWHTEDLERQKRIRWGLKLYCCFSKEKRSVFFNDFDRISNSYKPLYTHPEVSLLMHALRAIFFGSGRCSPTDLCECSLFPPFLHHNMIWSEKGLLNGLNQWYLYL